MVISGGIQGACRRINRSWQWIKWKLGRGRQMLRLQSLSLDGWSCHSLRIHGWIGSTAQEREERPHSFSQNAEEAEEKSRNFVHNLYFDIILNTSLVFCFLIMQLLYYKPESHLTHILKCCMGNRTRKHIKRWQSTFSFTSSTNEGYGQIIDILKGNTQISL